MSAEEGHPPPTVCITGLSMKEVVEILSKVHPTIELSIPTNATSSEGGGIHVYEADPLMQQKLDKLEKKKTELNSQLTAAMKSVKSFQSQQQALFDEFVLLREKYDQQKGTLVNSLWIQCGENHPDLRSIPLMMGPDFVEHEYELGSYAIGSVLGEGQFAAVSDCFRGDSKIAMAIKKIKKDRIISFASLKRIATEIETLKELSHSDYIVKIIDVIQTEKHLYIITEKGGLDLFEFFDEHAQGVSEKWATEIISGVLEAVLFCHTHNICHRDLKPENILLKFDVKAGRCIDLKLCDFGLSTKFEKKVPLSDFCGSPGFFAPEMLSLGNYYGDKADVWSLGCILLELVLGHEHFCDLWMVAYDYSVMQDRNHFESEIMDAVKKLPTELHFSADLNDILIKFLTLDPVKRPTCLKLCTHPWFGDRFLSVLHDLQPQPSNNPQHPSSPVPNALMPKTGPLVINTNQSLRERRFFASGTKIKPGGGGALVGEAHDDSHLPPIEPPTPCVGKARKMLITSLPIMSKSPLTSPCQSPRTNDSSRSNSFGSKSVENLRAIAVARLTALEEAEDDDAAKALLKSKSV